MGGDGAARPAGGDAAGAVPLLLLPGTACDARVFAPVRDGFRNRPVIHIPLPGVRDVAAMAAVVLDAAPERFAIVGLSLGGIAALHVALAAPSRVAGLALLAANARAVPADRRDARRREAAAAALDLDAHARAVLAPLYAGRAAARDPGFARLVAVMAQAVGPVAFVDQTEAALTRPDLRVRLGEIGAPVAVIGGEEDQLGTPEMQHELADGLADAELTLLPRTGHLLCVEAPDAVAAALAAWLARVDAGAGGMYPARGEEHA